MKLFLYWLVLLFVVTGCTMSNDMRNKPFEKEQLASEATIKTMLKLKKETELYPCGFGGSAMDEIKMLAISFNYYKSLDIESGRALLIKSVNTLVEEVNKIEEIRPYLIHYPFEARDVEIRIFVQDTKNFEAAKSPIHILSALEGILEYDVFEPGTYNLKHVFSETYEEAIQKLNI